VEDMTKFSLRKLELQNLDDAVAEANALMLGGYRQVGNWNLSQILGHCSDWMRFPMEGYPSAKFPIGWILALIRLTMGKALYRKTIREKGFKSGNPTVPATVKPKDAKQDAEALREFAEVVERFKNFRGQPHPSPLFGPLTYDQHRELQVVHVQHHLRYLLPISEHAVDT
jgi:hypothetical protein